MPQVPRDKELRNDITESVDLLGSFSADRTTKQKAMGFGRALLDSVRESRRAERTSGPGYVGLARKESEGIEPDRARRALSMAFKLRIPSSFVLKNLDDIEEDAKRQDFDEKTYVRSPQFARFLSNDPIFMAAAGEDAEAFGNIERHLRTPPELRRKPDEMLRKESEDMFSDYTGGEVVWSPGSRFATTTPTKEEKIAQDYAARKRVEEIVAGEGKIGFFEATGGRFSENPIFFLPFLASVTDTHKTLRLYWALKASKAGTATKEQKDFVIQTARLEASARKRGTSFMGGVASLLTELPAFAGEFASTSGIYSGVKAGALKVTHGMAKNWATYALREGLAVATASGAQTALNAPLRIAEGTVRRMTPVFALTADEQGKLQPVIADTEDGFLTAFTKSVGSAYIETLSERSGVLFEYMTGPLKRIVIGRWLMKNTGKGVDGFLKKLQKFGWHGPINEMLEERVGEVLRAGAQIEDYEVPTLEQIAQELVAFSGPGAVGFAGEVLQKRMSPADQQTEQELRAHRAVAQAESVKDVSKELRESKIAKQSPEATEQILKELSEGEGIETYYQTAQEWNKYWTEKGMDPREMAAKVVEDMHQYYDAVVTGGTFAMSASKYHSAIGQTEHGGFFQDEIRIGDPGEMNGREGREIAKRVAVEASAAEVGAEALPEGFESEVLEITDTVADMLRKAGFSKLEARVQAQVFGARARIRALVRGETPRAVFAELGLQVKREVAPAKKAPEVAPTAAPKPEVAPTATKLAEGDLGAQLAEKVAGIALPASLSADVALPTPAEVATAAEAALPPETPPAVPTEPAPTPPAVTRVKPEDIKRVGELFQTAAARPGDFNQKAIEAAVKEFGTTDDINEAGFILPDGRMLKFGEGGVRTIAHGVGIERLFAKHKAIAKRIGKKGALAVLGFQRETGAVRIASEGGGLSLVGVPTRQQLERFVPQYRRRFLGESVAVDVLDPKTGSVVNSADVTPTVDSIFGVLGKEFFQPGKRGRLRIAPKGIDITLFQSADLSTLLHETGHLWMTEVGQDESLLRGRDPAALTNMQKRFLDDAHEIREFLKIESFDELHETEKVKIRGKTAQVLTKKATDLNEKWARSVEAYLMRGEAPSLGLRAAFARFREWLTTIYKTVRGLDVELSPEVVSVMDRLLSTEREIAQAWEVSGYVPLIEDPKALGLSDSDAASYEADIVGSRQEAEDELFDKEMDALRKERGPEFRKAWDDTRAKVHAEYRERPLYRAIAAVQKGTLPNGGPLPEGVIPPGFDSLKIYKQQVHELYPTEQMAARVRRIDKKYPGFFAEGVGMPVDVVANSYGFKSGAELLGVIDKTEKLDTVVNRVTDERLRMIRPGLYPAPTKEDVLRAIHNKRHARVVAAELKHLIVLSADTVRGLAKLFVGPITSQQAIEIARREAERIVLRQGVGALKPHSYRLAAIRARKETAEAFSRNDYSAAADAKVRELLNTELYSIASDTKAGIKKALDGFKDFGRGDEAIAGYRDLDIVNAGRVVLGLFGIGSSKMEQSARAHLEKALRHDKDSFEVMSRMVDASTVNARDYHDISIAEFDLLRKTVEALWDMSRKVKQVEIGKKARSRDSVVDALVAQVGRFTSKKMQREFKRASRLWAATESGILSIEALAARTEQWCLAMDAGNDARPYWNSIFRPISEAATRFRVAEEKMAGKLKDILAPRTKELHSGRIADRLRDGEADTFAPFLREIENKADLLGALLHSGTTSNLDILLRGYHWGDYNQAGELDTSRWDAFVATMINRGILTKEDFETVQKIWDLADELLPQSQKVHKKLYGFFHGEIERRPIVNKFGAFRGGYAPAVPDYNKNPSASLQERDGNYEEDIGFVLPGTGRGHTKNRTGAARQLKLDVLMMSQHFSKVLRFIHIQPAVKDVNSIIFDNRFGVALDAHNRKFRHGALVPWLRRAASQRLAIRSVHPELDAIGSILKRNVGVAYMALRVSVALVQYTGIMMSFTNVKGKYMREALWSYWAHPFRANEIVFGKSEYMRTSQMTRLGEFKKEITRIATNPFTKFNDYALEQGAIMARFTQGHVSSITWMGRYNQAIAEEGKSEEEAVAVADSSVRITQGSPHAEDRSRIESGAPLVQTVMQFMTFFNMQVNLQFMKHTIAVREKRLGKITTSEMTWRMVHTAFFGYLSVTALEAAMRQVLRGDDDENWSTDYLSNFASESARTLLTWVPGAGPILSQGLDLALEGLFEKSRGYYTGNIAIAPAVSATEAGFRGAGALVALVTKGEEPSGWDVRNFLTGVTALTGLPVAALAPEASYIWDVSRGKKKPKNVFDFARGTVTGR